MIIAAGDGAYRTRTVQRKPVDERWSEEAVRKITGVLWRKRDNDPNADGEAMKSRPLSDEERRIIEQRNQAQQDLQNAPKRFGITMADLQKHGVTQGCSGCKSAFTGRVRQPHTKECRARFEKLLEGESRVKASRDRADEFYAKVTEADHERREADKRRKT